MSRFDTLAKIWDAKPRRLFQAENIYKAIKAKVDLPGEIKLLDIGTGTGLLLIHFVDDVKHLTGVDNSAGMLEVFGEKIKKTGLTNIDHYIFDAEKDNLNEAEYDLVVSSMTFHHFTRPEEVLKKVFKSLRPGGKICIGDLDEEDGSFHTDNSADNVKHFGFNKNIFNQWMKDAGFINTSVDEIFRIHKNETEYPVFLAYGEKKQI